MLYGVDVHGDYQRGLDFAALARQGYAFSVTKATEGTTYHAPSFVEWTAQARKAGLIPGAYHWLHRGNAVEQARFFHNSVKAAGGPTGMLIQLDCEDDADWPTLQAWDAEWARLTGGHPYLIYTGAWWWDRPERAWPGVTLTPYLWHSRYLQSDTDSVPDNPVAVADDIPSSWWTPSYGGWPAATILQFTSRGDAGGLANNVDLNATRLTREQLLALTRPGGDDMSLTPVQAQQLAAATRRDEARVKGESTYDANWTASTTDKETSWEVLQLAKVQPLADQVAALHAKLDALLARPAGVSGDLTLTVTGDLHADVAPADPTS